MLREDDPLEFPAPNALAERQIQLFQLNQGLVPKAQLALEDDLPLQAHNIRLSKAGAIGITIVNPWPRQHFVPRKPCTHPLHHAALEPEPRQLRTTGLRGCAEGAFRSFRPREPVNPPLHFFNSRRAALKAGEFRRISETSSPRAAASTLLRKRSFASASALLGSWAMRAPYSVRTRNASPKFGILGRAQDFLASKCIVWGLLPGLLARLIGPSGDDPQCRSSTGPLI